MDGDGADVGRFAGSVESSYTKRILLFNSRTDGAPLYLPQSFFQDVGGSVESSLSGVHARDIQYLTRIG